jgi:hypothetical protein
LNAAIAVGTSTEWSAWNAQRLLLSEADAFCGKEKQGDLKDKTLGHHVTVSAVRSPCNWRG